MEIKFFFFFVFCNRPPKQGLVFPPFPPPWFVAGRSARFQWILVAVHPALSWALAGIIGEAVIVLRVPMASRCRSAGCHRKEQDHARAASRYRSIGRLDQGLSSASSAVFPGPPVKPTNRSSAGIALWQKSSRLKKATPWPGRRKLAGENRSVRKTKRWGAGFISRDGPGFP